MSRGNWRILAAIGGLALLAAKPSGEGQPQQQQIAKAEIASTGKPAALHEPDPTPASEKPCAKGQDDHASDLCAQWKAADAASSAADAAWFFGYAGVSIGFLTLLAAAAAAIYARSAAIHTETSAKSFIESERAILRVVSAYEGNLSGANDGRKIIAVVFKNVGRTATRITAFGSKVTGSAPRWLGIPADCEGAVAGAEIPDDRATVLNGWFWIEYTLVGGGTGTANFRIEGGWRPDDGYTGAQWAFTVSNANGHPEDT